MAETEYAGSLRSTRQDGRLAFTNNIYDEELGMMQSAINQKAAAQEVTIIENIVDGGKGKAFSAEAAKSAIMNYDCSKGGTVTFNSLSEALAAVPAGYRKGGMTITVILGSGSYSLYRCKTGAFSDKASDWQNLSEQTVTLGAVVEALNTMSAPTSEGYLHFDGSGYDWKMVSSGSGTADSVTWTNVTGKPTWAKSDDAFTNAVYNTTVASAISASEAGHLSTARTLWGQSFTGNSNVNGDMSEVGNITMQSGTAIKMDTATLQAADNVLHLLTDTNAGTVNIGGNKLQIGNAFLVWDDTAKTLKLTGADGGTVNFAATGGVSASNSESSTSTDSSSGSGTTTDIDASDGTDIDQASV